MVDYLLQQGAVTHVLWVDPYPTRLPKLRDLSIRFSSEKHVCESIDGVKISQPKALPIEPLPVLHTINRWGWRNTRAEISSFVEIAPSIIGVGRPSRLAVDILSRYPQALKFMDIMDDFSAFYSGLSRFSMFLREQEVAKLADHLFCSAPALMERLPDFTFVRRCRLMPNGYPMKRLLNLPDIKRESDLIGFVGTIADWFDWPLVIEIAKALPTKRIRLVGPVRCAVPSNLPMNIQMLPECSLSEAIQHTLKFAVGLIPFKKNRLTKSVDPIKFYEMRALGVPIWSTSFGTMEDRIKAGDVLGISSGCDWEALYGRSNQFRLRGKELDRFRSENDWSSRFKPLNELFKKFHPDDPSGRY
ncbi:hypothetical protein [Jeongeupia chitinilytica]|nr:hypothetical protein [Jeongeupia chitinilytica]